MIRCTYDKNKRRLLSLKGLNFTSQEKARVPGSVSRRLSISLSRLIYAMIPGVSNPSCLGNPRDRHALRKIRDRFLFQLIHEKTVKYIDLYADNGANRKKKGKPNND